MYSIISSKFRSGKKWIQLRGYSQGIFWATLAILTGNLNDILTRFSVHNLSPEEVTFFRYFFATLTLLPFMLRSGSKSFQTKRFFLHFFRSGLLFTAVFCWTKGLMTAPLIMGGIFAQTTQLFVFFMALIFLKEPFCQKKIFSVFIGFLGVIIITIDKSNTNELFILFYKIKNSSLFFLLSSLCFAISDIVNKRYICEEPLLPMLFYLYVGTLIFSLYPTILHWQSPSAQDLFFLFLLGFGGNALLFFLLKSFEATNISDLVSIRYLEIFSAGLLGYLFFSEIPSSQILLGGFLIIVGATTMNICKKNSDTL